MPALVIYNHEGTELSILGYNIEFPVDIGKFYDTTPETSMIVPHKGHHLIIKLFIYKDACQRGLNEIKHILHLSQRPAYGSALSTRSSNYRYYIAAVLRGAPLSSQSNSETSGSNLSGSTLKCRSKIHKARLGRPPLTLQGPLKSPSHTPGSLWVLQ